MWPVVLALLRRNAVYITLPVAAVIGFVGFHLEGLISDKYTPYTESIQEKRAERLAADEMLDHAADTKLQLGYNTVLDRNLPPSLKKN